MPKSPDKIIREEILALSAYHVPPAQGMVKLDAMENPYSLPEPLREEIGRLAAGAAINRYPDPSGTGLKAVLREAMDIPAGMDVLLGNGSDEIIEIITLATARRGAVIMSVEPTFVMFRMIATFAGVEYAGVPLKEDFTLDLDAMLTAIERHKPAVIFLAYPNNPTGNLFDAEAISRIIEQAPGLVVVDEAYYAFADASFMGQLALYPNLALMRTLSKLGLAGLRLGLLIGSPAWLAHFEKLRLPYNVNVLTQAIAATVLRHKTELLRQADAIKRERAYLLECLGGIEGIRAYSSDANFILFRVERADKIFDGLKQRGILIKNFNGTHPLLAGCLRVTVGTADENRRFLLALKQIISA